MKLENHNAVVPTLHPQAIENWESQDEPEHLTIRDRSPPYKIGDRLLGKARSQGVGFQCKIREMNRKSG
jgi:hypothetical protein